MRWLLDNKAVFIPYKSFLSHNGKTSNAKAKKSFYRIIHNDRQSFLSSKSVINYCDQYNVQIKGIASTAVSLSGPWSNVFEVSIKYNFSICRPTCI